MTYESLPIFGLLHPVPTEYTLSVMPQVQENPSLPHPFQVYHRRKPPSVVPPSPAPIATPPNSPPASIQTSRLDLLIAFRKGIQSNCNSSPNHVDLSYYHDLSPMHFLSFLPCHLCLFLRLQVKLFLIPGGDRLW